jgi:FkbM family methyltransferase
LTAFNRLLESGATLQKAGDKNIVNFEHNGIQRKVLLRRGTSDGNIFVDVFLNNSYKNFIDLARKYNVEVNTIVDAGANIGLTTLYLKTYYPHARVISLEPFPANTGMLKSNIDLNRLEKVHIEQKGLWGKSCHLKNRTSFRDNEPWSFSLDETDDPGLALFSALSVPDLLALYKIPSIDLLKIDIEGGEVSVFSEQHKPLEWLNKVKIMAIEIHDEFNCREQIESLLKANHFELLHDGELTYCVNRQLAK